MGLFDSFCDFVDGCIESVSDFCSSVKNFVGDAFSAAIETVSKLGPEIWQAGAAVVVHLAKLVPGLGKFAVILEIAVKVIQLIAVALDILKPDEELEELGEKALQAEEQNGIKRENFTTSKEYVDAVRAQKIDDAKLHTKEERQFAGMAVLLEAVPEHINLPSSLYATAVIHEKFLMEFSRLQHYVELSQKTKFPLGRLKGFFENTLPLKEWLEVESFLHNAEKENNPNYDKNDFSLRLDQECAMEIKMHGRNCK